MTAPDLHLAGKTPPGGPARTRHAVEDRVRRLNAKYRHHSATDVMHAARSETGKTALVSSFGAESIVLLHMVAISDPALPVLFIDTELLFTETLVYQQEVTERLGLKAVRILKTMEGATRDPHKALHRNNPDACCDLRKTRPLHTALAPYDAWITGRKRFQSGARAALDFFEVEDVTGRIKINPLAHWTPEDVHQYMDENRLPRHPLVARGFPSIGCAPCTSPVAPGENARAGRWRNQTKDECGIHFVNGALVRTGASS